MEIKSISQPGYEEVVSCSDPASGLRAFIAIHSTRLGPALGGIRMYPYSSENDALADVLRLAKAMTYKAAAARLKLGGGKAVVIGSPETNKNGTLLRSLAQFIHHLEGRYISAKDAGITTADLVHISNYTPHVTGLPEGMGGSDDPSPWTALTLLEGIRACVKARLGKDSLKGLRVLVQGTGHVGNYLCGLLNREGAELSVADIRPEEARKAARLFGAAELSAEEVYTAETDVFSPCAMGGVINDATLGRLKCRIIAGGANNQLLDERAHGRLLEKRGILYAPDYVINAGGIINIYVKDILKKKDCMPWIRRIGTTLDEIFSLGVEREISTAEAANLYAENLLEAGPSAL